ncbi:hypothetical protein OAR97_06320 [Arcobacteraceae bacterium]|nr:hypothetical protein [Arcobacteraceae bacterium]
MYLKIFILSILFSSLLFSSENYNENYRYRKYIHVKEFYELLTKDTIDLSLKYNIPPAAVLAIASVESGYGRGYVAKITGNILSLGANKNEKELPSLFLPNVIKTKNILYNSLDIERYTKDELRWKQREKSLKKDYRPDNIAGTTKRLDYFDNHTDKRREANLQNIRDFATKWISFKKSHKAFKDARKMIEKNVAIHGKKILFDKEFNKKFIRQIGGKDNSFNYRKSWPKKVISILNNSGLVELTSQIHFKNKSFDEAW